jgi:hypothetical protein
LAHDQLTTAGPKETAGFMDAPSNAPPAKMLAPTIKPIAMGAIIPMLPFFGSKAVAYTVYTKPNVITISNTTAFHTLTSEDKENADVDCAHQFDLIKNLNLTKYIESCAYTYIENASLNYDMIFKIIDKLKINNHVTVERI